VVGVPGYRSRDPGFDSRRYHIFWGVVDLERGPFSLVSITEELLGWRSSSSGSRQPRSTAVGIRCADHTTPSLRKSWHQLCRRAAVACSVYFACGLKPRSLVQLSVVCLTTLFSTWDCIALRDKIFGNNVEESSRSNQEIPRKAIARIGVDLNFAPTQQQSGVFPLERMCLVSFCDLCDYVFCIVVNLFVLC
jgi:hypothetical protein